MCQKHFSIFKGRAFVMNVFSNILFDNIYILYNNITGCYIGKAVGDNFIDISIRSLYFELVFHFWDFIIDVSLGLTKENRKGCSGDSFFYWDIIYFNTDLHNEDNGGIGCAKAVFCQTGEFR